MILRTSGTETKSNEIPITQSVSSENFDTASFSSFSRSRSTARNYALLSPENFKQVLRHYSKDLPQARSLIDAVKKNIIRSIGNDLKIVDGLKNPSELLTAYECLRDKLNFARVISGFANDLPAFNGPERRVLLASKNEIKRQAESSLEPLHQVFVKIRQEFLEKYKIVLPEGFSLTLQDMVSMERVLLECIKHATRISEENSQERRVLLASKNEIKRQAKSSLELSHEEFLEKHEIVLPEGVSLIIVLPEGVSLTPTNVENMKKALQECIEHATRVSKRNKGKN
jgi:hypothetical protein